MGTPNHLDARLAVRGGLRSPSWRERKETTRVSKEAGNDQLVAADYLVSHLYPGFECLCVLQLRQV